MLLMRADPDFLLEIEGTWVMVVEPAKHYIQVADWNLIQPPTLFEFSLECVTDRDVIQDVKDLVQQQGKYTAAYSTDNDPSSPYAFDLQCNNFQFQLCRWEHLNYDLMVGHFSITGRCETEEFSIATTIRGD